MNRATWTLLLLAVLLAGCRFHVAADAAAPQIVGAVTPAGKAVYLADLIHIQRWAVCVRSHETPGNGAWPFEDGYVYASTNGYLGAYQFTPGLWSASLWAAEQQGLVPAGTWTKYLFVPIHLVPWWVQDAAAIAQYRLSGDRHWGNRCP